MSEEPNLLLLQGHALEVLKQFPDGFFQTCCTSPPYWGLRQYSGEQDLIWESSSRYGMWKGQLGQEPCLDMYIDHLVQIFREVRRVLRSDGTLWIVVGDAYFGGKGKNGNSKARRTAKERGYQQNQGTPQMDTRVLDLPQRGLKPKDLCGVPWKLAFALRDDKWWLRSSIIWEKPSCMPESVHGTYYQQDEDGNVTLKRGSWRPTVSYEHIFLLTKTAYYFLDGEAVKEPATSKHPSGNGYKRAARLTYLDANGPRGSDEQYQPSEKRNLRSVWYINTEGTKYRHYATFPKELPRLMVQAGTSEKGNCPKCGQPYVRIIKKYFTAHDGNTETNYPEGSTLALLRQAARERGEEYVNRTETVGWKATCTCEEEPVPAWVLDPFSGIATTCITAKELGRNSVGIDISAEYIEMAQQRIAEGK